MSLKKLINGKHFPVNEKHFPVNFSKKRNLTWFSGKCFLFSCVCFPESDFRVCLPVEKLVNGKHFPVKGKFGLDFQESVFLKNLGGKHFPEVVKNLEMSLFVDYIKYDPQTFDWYIYFVLNIYFSISSLIILFLY